MHNQSELSLEAGAERGVCMKRVFRITGVDCPQCAKEVEKCLCEVPGVRKAEIDTMTGRLTVTGEDSPDLAARLTRAARKAERGITVSEGRKTAEENGKEAKKTGIQLLCGAAVMVPGVILWETDTAIPLAVCLMIAAYAILGFEVLISAVRGIFRGELLDERFLMSVSTIGAFAIGEVPEAVAVMLFYRIGEWLQHLALARSRRSLRALMDIRPDTACVLRDGREAEVPCDEVAVGENVMVRPGERIPIDGTVVSGESSLDLSALTGESVPVRVAEGDPVYSGGVNQSGALTVKTGKLFAESTASRIIDMVENASSRKAPSERFITRFSRVYTPVVVAGAVLLAVLPPLFLGNWTEWLRRALVFLVISCPCAFVISVPLTFFCGVGAASRRGVLVKGGGDLDALSRADTVIFDKTGTLTRGEFQVSALRPASGISPDDLLTSAALAERWSTHPIARSILRVCQAVPEDTVLSDYREVRGGVTVTAGGIPLCAGSEKLMEQNGVKVPAPVSGGVSVYVTKGGAYLGCVDLADIPREDAADTVRGLYKRGIKRCVMLTGDGEEAAKEVARQVGISEVRAGLLPEQKVQAVEQLEAEGCRTVFVGDGINDAPVLARAGVGVAMGGLGADAAIDAADVVLMTDEPAKLLGALDVAKRTKTVAVQNIVLAIGVKAAFLLLGALGMTNLWFAVFADVGVMLLAVGNALRAMK